MLWCSLLKSESVSTLLIVMLNGLVCKSPTILSLHIIPTKGLFTTYKGKDFGTVNMSNSNYSKIMGISDVCIETNVGSTVILKDLQHVLDLMMNAFSTFAMNRAGYCNHLGNRRWKLTKGSLIIARRHACC